MLRARSARLILLLLVIPVALLAHFTWLAPASGPLVPGKPYRLQIGHGHAFPASEEAVNAAQVKAFVADPGGTRAELPARREAKALVLEWTPKQKGLHVFYFTQDRGEMSRTPEGVKPGGRDRNPGAAAAFRAVRTGVVYAAHGEAALTGRPLGLPLEIVPVLDGSTLTLRLLQDGKPAAGAVIRQLQAGSEEAREAGKTDRNGELRLHPGSGVDLAAPFAASMSVRMAPGANIDTVNLETTLLVVR